MKIKYQKETEVGGVKRVVQVELDDAPTDVGFIGGVIGTFEEVIGNEARFASGIPLARDVVVRHPASVHDEVKAEESARNFERAEHRSSASQGIRSLRGHPRTVRGFTNAEAFAVFVRYFRALGFRYPVKQVRDWWESGIPPAPRAPTTRQVDEAIAKVRGWNIRDLRTLADTLRDRRRLPPLPTQRPMTRAEDRELKKTKQTEALRAYNRHTT